jgi:hypothetical protein
VCNPTADWIAGQVTETFPWNEAPKRLLRDREFRILVEAMGITEVVTASRSPWQNAYVGFSVTAVRTIFLRSWVRMIIT